MLPVLLRRSIPYLLVIAGALACLWLAYSHGVSVTTTEWQGKWDKQALELSDAKAKALTLVREEEQRRQASIDKVTQDAEKQIAMAEADATAADAAAHSLREQAKRLAARANQCAGNTGTSSGSETANSGTKLLPELLESMESAGRAMAKEADRRRIAGTACESAYDAIRKEK